LSSRERQRLFTFYLYIQIWKQLGTLLEWWGWESYVLLCADKSLARQGRKQANISVRMTWISLGALPCRKITWWQLASRWCWNRTRPWYASELVSFLVGLRTYQHPGSAVTSPPAGRPGFRSRYGLNYLSSHQPDGMYGAHPTFRDGAWLGRDLGGGGCSPAFATVGTWDCPLTTI